MGIYNPETAGALGLGTMAFQNANNVAITGGSVGGTTNISTTGSSSRTSFSSTTDLTQTIGSVLTLNPAGNSTSVNFTIRSECVWDSSFNLTGNAHYGSYIGFIDNIDSGTVTAAYNIEARQHCTSGSFSFQVGNTVAWQTVSEGAAGTVSVAVGYYFPALSDHAYISSKFCFLNQEPTAVFRSSGRAILSYTQDGGGNLLYQQEVIPRNRSAIAPNRYYPIEGVNALYPATTLTRGVIWAVPIVVSNRTTFTRIGFILGTGIASVIARLGIWGDGPAKPDKLILDAGTVTCGVADVGNREATISLTLDPGTYWLAIQASGGAADPAITFAGTNGFNVMGMSTATGQENTTYVANVGAFPSSYGTPTYAGGGFAPYMWLRQV